MRLPIRYFVALGILIVVMVTVGWVGHDWVFPLRNVTVETKWLHQAQFAGMYVADTKRIYRNHGLNVTIRELDINRDRLEDLKSGTVDFTLMTAEGLITAVHNGADIKAVAAIYQTSPYVFVALKNSGIVTPADFKGKVLGNKGKTLEQDLLYALLLKSFGLTEADVTIKDLDFEKTELENLHDGDADVIGLYRTDQLFTFDQMAVDYQVIYPEQYSIHIYNDVLVTRNDLIAHDPELVKDFVQATIKGWDYALEHPEEAVNVTMRYVTADHYQSEEYQRYILQKSEPLIRENSVARIGFMGFSEWSRLQEQLYKQGMISSSLVEYTDLFTNEFIP